MSKSSYKLLTAAVWVLVVFSGLYILQEVYKKNESFHLFVILALSMNVAYDGIKAILKFPAMYVQDAKKLFNLAVLTVLSFAASFLMFLVGAALHVYLELSLVISQAVAVVGYLVFFIITLSFLQKIDNLFKVQYVP
ncbi:hypothetical protein OH214_10860 [Idiomarina abyssalis]|uniref:hypothetical protein n=1 Tax=Idiomarina abyssalis TaxID=86102 RepID=UPI0023003A03|nr:hypothetical protein [Idiomarina abyssalis]MDA6067634.1 hypothetical protein [Idiomarina abyssalis]